MNKNLILFTLAVVLSLGAILCFQALKQSEENLVVVEEKLAAFDTYKAIDIKVNESYENALAKYSETEIDTVLYYGYQHQYETEDIYFFSLTDAWDEEKLKEVEEELYKNVHGDEIRFLDKVILHGYTGGDAAGTHSQTINSFELPLSLYNFFPEDTKYYAPYKESTIHIYGVTEDTEIKDIAYVLSHEYGHHFTQYYFDLKFDGDDIDTEYYKIRLSSYDNAILERESYINYIDNHARYLAEIAAEDYAFLMGSDTSDKIIRFYDYYEKAIFKGEGRYSTIDNVKYKVKKCTNGMPHENIALPLPSECEELIQFFYSFVDEEAPVFEKPEDIGDLNLAMEKTEGENKHLFTWDQPYTDSDVVYTLIGYDENDNIVVIVKTTYGNGTGMAHLGHYRSSSTQSKIDNSSFIYDEGATLNFVVSVTFPDGTVLLSDPLEITY